MNPPLSITVPSPAKINLFLAVTARRDDRYHDLVSVAAPLDFGDELTVATVAGGDAAGSKSELVCSNPAVPLDDSNLVLVAARVFRNATGWLKPVRFTLQKRVPMQSGLGGGSSNAVAALEALNRLSGAKVSPAALGEMAAAVGSDCPLFLAGGPVIMRGRGDRIEELASSAAQRLRGRRVIVFKPAGMAVDTAWAYRQLAAGAPGSYLAAAEAERRLAVWISGRDGPEKLLFNNLEAPVFRKFLALPALLDRLRERFGLAAGMSGSGSACFALPSDDKPVDTIIGCIREAWGSDCFIRLTTMAPEQG